MDREKIIQLIEQELVQADEASNEQQFEKHIYDSYANVFIYNHNIRPSSKSRNIPG